MPDVQYKSALCWPKVSQGRHHLKTCPTFGQTTSRRQIGTEVICLPTNSEYFEFTASFELTCCNWLLMNSQGHLLVSSDVNVISLTNFYAGPEFKLLHSLHAHDGQTDVQILSARAHSFRQCNCTTHNMSHSKFYMANICNSAYLSKNEPNHSTMSSLFPA